MAPIPYGPKLGVILRRRVLRHAMAGDSFAWNAIAILMPGRSGLLRSQVIRQGLRSASGARRAFSAFLIVEDLYQKKFAKAPEPLGAWTVGANSFLSVINAKPLSKKELKRSGTTKKELRGAIIAQAVADTRAAHPDAKIIVKTK